jgi:hypothetical protein
MKPRPATTARRARAFTLVEVVLAAALAALVMLGLQSAVLIAAKAVPSSAAPVGAAAQAAALERIARDLAYATRITASSSTSITFTVPDRTGDAVDDSITFRWSGVSGEPLTRSLNASAAETILSDVRALSLAFTTATSATDTTYTESSETLLAYYSSSLSLSNTPLSTTDFVGQLVPVSLPSNAVDFRTTRARLSVTNAGTATGVGVVELRTVCNGLPSLPVLAQGTFNEPSSSTTVYVPLAMSRYLDKAEPVIIIARYSTNAPAGAPVYRSSGVATASAAMLASTDAGATWTSNTARSLLYELWGVYRTLDDPGTRTRASAFQATVRSSTAAATEFHLPLTTRPEVGP